MNFGQMQDHVLTIAKRRNEPGERELIKQYLNEAYQEVATRTRILYTTASITLTGASDYSFADAGIDDIGSIRGIQYATSQAYSTRTLTNVDLETLLNARSVAYAPSGWMSAYAVDGDTLRLVSAPTAGETLTIYYTKRPIEMFEDEDTPDEVPPEFHRVITHGAIAQAAKDPGVSDRAAAQFEQGITRIKAWIGTRSGDFAPSVRIGQHRRRPRDPSYYGGGWS